MSAKHVKDPKPPASGEHVNVFPEKYIHIFVPFCIQQPQASRRGAGLCTDKTERLSLSWYSHGVSKHHDGAQQIKTESTSTPQGTQSILPSTSKIMLRPWGWGAVCPDSSSCQTVTLRKIFLSHF